MRRLYVLLLQLVAFSNFVRATTEVYAGLRHRLTPRSNPITIPIHVQYSREIGDNGTVGAGWAEVASSQDRQSYFAIIKAGAISFKVALDTASSDLWLVSSACNTDTCRPVPRYPLSYQSPTFLQVNNNMTSFNASYADGTFASGFLARESIELANLTVPNQPFGMVTNSNVSLTDKASGIMGLGFPRLSSISNSTINSTSFFANLSQQGLLEYPLFAFSLTRNLSGSLSIGAVDASVVVNASQIGWNKVAPFPPFGSENNISSYFQWAIPLSGFSVNGTQVAPQPTYPEIRESSLALFDIGTSGIYGPYQDVTRLYSLINGARLVDSSGQWAIPCNTLAPISFTFGSRNYTLQPSDYMIGPTTGNPDLCLSWPRALPPSSDGIDWQMGSPFLRTVYSIFSFGINNQEPPLIGLYPLQQPSNSTNTTQSSNIISSIFSANSATVTTTLPNVLLATPTYSTPPYALNSSLSAPIGVIVSSGLATSTYSALFGQQTSLLNTSALPTISPTPTVFTYVLTDAVGLVTTSVSTRVAAITLGLPPGWSAASSLQSSFSMTILGTLVAFLWTLHTIL